MITKKISLSDLRPGMIISKLDRQGVKFSYYGIPLPDRSVIEYLKKNDINHVYVLTDGDESETKSSYNGIDLSSDVSQIEKDQLESLFSSFSYDVDEEQKLQIEDIGKLEDLHSAATKEMSKILKNLKFAMSLDIPAVRGILNDFVFLAAKKPRILASSIRLKYSNDYLSNHSVNVCLLSLAIAGRLKMSLRDINNLGLAAILHDIGMTKVPDNIVEKPHKLTEHEFDKIIRHPISGYEIAKRWDRSIPKSVLMGILQHHERIDGSGYPYKASGSDISVFAQIICIADVYDALTSHKQYRQALTHMQVLKILYDEAGKSLHKRIVTALISLVGVYPVSTILQLDSGKCAVVLDVNPDVLDRPKVIIFADDNKEKITPYFEDLSKSKEKIRRIIMPDEIDVEPNNIITAFLATRMLD